MWVCTVIDLKSAFSHVIGSFREITYSIGVVADFYE